MFKEFYWWTTEVVNVYAYYPRRCIGSAYASAVIYVSDLKAIFRDGRFAHAQAERALKCADAGVTSSKKMRARPAREKQP